MTDQSSSIVVPVEPREFFFSPLVDIDESQGSLKSFYHAGQRYQCRMGSRYDELRKTILDPKDGWMAQGKVRVWQ